MILNYQYVLDITSFGWSPNTTLLIFFSAVLIASLVFITVIYTSRVSVQRFREKKKYRLEAIWAISVIGILIWLYLTTIQYTPPSTFSDILKGAESNNQSMQVVNITAGQWFWIIERLDLDNSNKTSSLDTLPENSQSSNIARNTNNIDMGDNDNINDNSLSSVITVRQNIPVKFVATSIDVNHGFGIFSGPEDGSPILLQMQIIPGIQNIFYYTFKDTGIYNIRCLEYCGYAHPYMTTKLHVISDTGMNKTDSGDNDGRGI